MTRLLLIMFAGGLGTGLRYGIHTAMRKLGDGFPFGILTVNLLGCFLAGLLGAIFLSAAHLREDFKLAIMIGFLGGLTTFSSYAFDTLELWLDQRPTAAFVNVIVNNVGCLFVVGLGYWIGSKWTGMPVVAL
ncbi:MAG: fluoride efflux transporter CrcB [Phycisphaeraceae bacterium]